MDEKEFNEWMDKRENRIEYENGKAFLDGFGVLLKYVGFFFFFIFVCWVLQHILN